MHIALQAEQQHHLNLAQLEQRLVTPTFEVHQSQRRLRCIEHERRDELARFKSDFFEASIKHRRCHLMSLDVSWNVDVKQDSRADVHAAARALGQALSVVPTMTSLHSSGNNFPLGPGVDGAGTIGAGIGKGQSVQVLP